MEKDKKPLDGNGLGVGVHQGSKTSLHFLILLSHLVCFHAVSSPSLFCLLYLSHLFRSSSPDYTYKITLQGASYHGHQMKDEKVFKTNMNSGILNYDNSSLTNLGTHSSTS